MESSRRDLSNDMAEHRPILKYNLNTSSRFSFTPKTGMELPKTGVDHCVGFKNFFKKEKDGEYHTIVGQKRIRL